MQARFGWSEETNGADSSLDIGAGRQASAVLAVMGMRYALSRATVHHFLNVTSGEDRDRGEADCRERLRRFRGIG